MIPRPEHPRPQFERTRWINLNGTWDFSFDFGESGIERGYQSAQSFDRKITVPFAPESALSGVGYRDFIRSCWYHREIEIPAEWSGQNIYLRFGAVDYECAAFIDGVRVGRHYGGSSSFAFDITFAVSAGRRHHLVVHAIDDVRSGMQPSGKQSVEYHSAGCFYTRVTGIWQTVWLEAVSPLGLESCDVTTNVVEGTVVLSPLFSQFQRGRRLRATVLDHGAVVTKHESTASNGHQIVMAIDRPILWSPQRPHLYDLTIEVLDESGSVVDTVRSYFGMREVGVEGDRIYLNGEELYLRFVLDQGYYPDGLWTAPSDAALRRDIELGMRTGFNGARLHQRVFEERYHYWADRLGYLTWSESPSWGLSLQSGVAARNFLMEWQEIVMQKRNHPSIIAWTTLNESWDISNLKEHNRLHLDVYNLTRAIDPTRPISNASGGCQVKTDIYTCHIYEQDARLLEAKLTPHPTNGVYRTLGEREVPYQGQPYIVAEFGGIKWIPDRRAPFSVNSWGYGQVPESVTHFYEQLRAQVAVLRALPHISGFCYTQLTDVEQEENGLFTYDREEKFEGEQLRLIFGGEALEGRHH